MSDQDQPDRIHTQTSLTETQSGKRPPASLPGGYRQGIITAITVLLGFSLGFLRFWVLEAPGKWDTLSVAAAVMLVLSLLGQIAALYRSLLLSDETEHEYRKTVRWFIISVFVLIIGLALSIPNSV